MGKATRLIEYQSGLAKKYRAEMVLGQIRDTQDRTGIVIEERDVSHIKKEDVLSAISDFTGTIEQTPPMYSAIKHKGERLYNLARKGIEVERKKRTIEIYEITPVDYKEHPECRVIFDVTCSTGTYVRTICEDIGLKLGCGAYMASLLRTKSGSFEVERSYRIEEIASFKENGKIEEILLPPLFSLGHLPSVKMAEEFKNRVFHGKKIYISHIQDNLKSFPSEEEIVLLDCKDNLLAVARLKEDNSSSYLQPVKVLAGLT